MSLDDILVKFKGTSVKAYGGNNQIGECHFTVVDGKWMISKTDVGVSYEGMGIGKRLVDEVVQNARSQNFKIFPMCPYARHVMLKNSDYSDILII